MQLIFLPLCSVELPEDVRKVVDKVKKSKRPGRQIQEAVNKISYSRSSRTILIISPGGCAAKNPTIPSLVHIHSFISIQFAGPLLPSCIQRDLVPRPPRPCRETCVEIDSAEFLSGGGQSGPKIRIK